MLSNAGRRGTSPRKRSMPSRSRGVGFKTSSPAASCWRRRRCTSRACSCGLRWWSWLGRHKRLARAARLGWWAQVCNPRQAQEVRRRLRSASRMRPSTEVVGRQLDSRRTAVTLGGRQQSNGGDYWWTVAAVGGRRWLVHLSKRQQSQQTYAILADSGNRPLGGRRWSNSSGSKRMEAVSLSLRGRRRSDGDRP